MKKLFLEIPWLQCLVAMITPASSIIFKIVPPWTFPAIFASSGIITLLTSIFSIDIFAYESSWLPRLASISFTSLLNIILSITMLTPTCFWHRWQQWCNFKEIFKTLSKAFQKEWNNFINCAYDEASQSLDLQRHKEYACYKCKKLENFCYSVPLYLPNISMLFEILILPQW